MVPAVRVQSLPSSASLPDSSNELPHAFLQIQMGSCNLELDPSFPDRFHRWMDALAAGQQTANQIVVTGDSNSQSFQGEDVGLHPAGGDSVGIRTWLRAGNDKVKDCSSPKK